MTGLVFIIYLYIYKKLRTDYNHKMLFEVRFTPGGGLSTYLAAVKHEINVSHGYHIVYRVFF